jgi:hypothetical protein
MKVTRPPSTTVSLQAAFGLSVHFQPLRWIAAPAPQARIAAFAFGEVNRDGRWRALPFAPLVCGLATLSNWTDSFKARGIEAPRSATLLRRGETTLTKAVASDV